VELTLQTPILELHRHSLPRVGPLTAKKLAVEIASITARHDPSTAPVEDLLHYVPMRYEDRSNLARVADLREGENASVEVTVRAGGVIPLRRGLRLYEMSATDGAGFVRAFWWNQVFLAKVFHPGDRVILYGLWKRGRRGDYFEVENPEYEILQDEDDDAETAAIHTARRVPVYHKLGELRTRQLRSILFHLLSRIEGHIAENLPRDILERNQLIDRATALRQIHFPAGDASIDEYNAARSPAHRRLVFEEFFSLMLALGLRRERRSIEPKGAQIIIDDRIREVVRSILPFSPTTAQKRVLKEIIDDMRSERPMNRLLQGDVGSGKTIVALQAMIVAVENGYQAALMAPTEILAEQHARNIRRILAVTKCRVGLLTGRLRAKEKSSIHEQIRDGEVDIIIGTHALIQDAVSFKRLGLVVIDEQHRFGVLQRAEMRARGLNPDVLVMTATPIPRSLAMTVYGDLEVSVIDELPPGRKPVATHVRGEDRREKIYEFIRQQVSSGRQAYVVYPIIEESEKLDLRNATEMYEHLRRDIFPELNVGLLHGRMKSADKDEVMSEFVANRIKILVATTVIEVGVDVSNATVMLIEHAERFGLSQLHQLRGRVGRGADESYCILLAQYEQTLVARERLRIMEETNDGFRIAEKDLEIRGPGELMGTRQSGLPVFRIANLVRDQIVLNAARIEADRLLESDSRERDVLVAQIRNEPRYGLAEIG
jgi:ATP-dependent DNA helicase RecG